MADDPNYRGPVDRERINVNQPHEVRWWCKELGCTESELRAAVQAVGVMVKDVRKHRKPPVQPRVSAIKKGGTVAT